MVVVPRWVNSPNQDVRLIRPNKIGLNCIRFWRPALLLSALLIVGYLPKVQANVICDQPGVECRAPDVGPWTFWASLPFPGTFPKVDGISSEAEAINAGGTASCSPLSGYISGHEVCSCSVTSSPTLTTTGTLFGIEMQRGPGQVGITQYLLSPAPFGDCTSPLPPWEFSWEVDGARTVTCPAGFSPDNQTSPEVCWRFDPCPNAAPKPYNPDPYPSDDIANLSPQMQIASQCFQTAVIDAGGTFRFKSAYRPKEYNLHLQEVWDKWDEFKDNVLPACQARRAEIENHFNQHELQTNDTARPHTYSAHTKLDTNGNPAGEAIDISSNLFYGVLDVLAFGCKLYGPDPTGDTPHFIHR